MRVGLRQAFLLTLRADYPKEQRRQTEGDRRGIPFNQQPEQRPCGRIAQHAHKIRQGPANANGPRPAQLMLPNRLPAGGRFPAVHHRARKLDPPARPRDVPPQFIIIRQIIRQRREPADLPQRGRGHGHDRAQRKIHRAKAAGLQHLAPKIGVDGDGLPAHGGRGRVGQPIKTIDKAGGRRGQKRRDTGRKIPARLDIGVAHHDQWVADVRFQLPQSGDLAVGPQVLPAKDQPRVRPGKLGQQFPHDPAHRIIRRGHAAQDLHRAWVLLREPASQTLLRFRVAALERFEQRQAGQRARPNRAAMQGKAFRDPPAPEGEDKAQNREYGKDPVQHD